MKVLKIILFIVIGVVALLVVVGLVLPKEMNVERSVVIDADKELVKDQVLKFKNFHEWSPWSKYDTTMKVTIEGEDGTVGAMMKWEGNDDVGVGSQEILSITDDRADIALTFKSPWEANDKTYFLFEEEAEEGVKVTWGMNSQTPFPQNLMMKAFGMEKQIGNNYEEGLATLKDRVENMEPPTSYRGYEIQEIEIEPKTYVALRETVKMDEMPNFFGEKFGSIMMALSGKKIEPAGAPSGIYFTWDEENNESDMAAAIPVDDEVELEGYTTITADGKALVLEYIGNYQEMMEPHNAMADYMTDRGLELDQMVIEEYLTNPQEEPDTSKWVTKVYYFVK